MEWKRTNLSMDERITLAQSSLFSMSGYIMQTVPLLVSLCEETEKFCRNFILDSALMRIENATYFLETIYKPKNEGGMGFRCIKTVNEVYMCKLAWKMVANPKKLWFKI